MRESILAWACVAIAILLGNLAAGAVAIAVSRIFVDMDDGILPGLVVGSAAVAAGIGSIWLISRALVRGLGRDLG